MTPHIEAEKKDIAKKVIMSGDPLRAEFIAKTYLTDYKLVNKVRGMYAYTGYYKGERITVMGHGMGMAGAGIYFYELFKIYDVDLIIRVGSCGTALEQIKLLDLILVEQSYTESNYAFVFSKQKIQLESSNKELNKKIIDVAINKNVNLKQGNVLTCDVFDPYVDWKAILSRVPSELNVIASEMESFALFHIANVLNKKASCILTVVDSKCTNNVISAKDRETALTSMIEIALDSIVS